MNKQVLITGISGGIGNALALAFRKAGYYVYGIDRVEQYGVPCDRFIEMDIHRFVQDTAYRIEAGSRLEELIPRLTVLVNNAAVQKLSSLNEIRLEDWQETMNVNLTAPLLLSRLFLPHLEAARGSILNIGSVHQQLTKPGFVAYATSKSGLAGLTRALAVDLQGRVRVNAISPAAIDTPMLQEALSRSGVRLEELAASHPVGRVGSPEDVAALALFIVSEAGTFLNGSNISMDGGIASLLRDR
jgi:NAD(P)-dependent dehydrogenase (short-subunit alcohol dehydrogenase family)